MHQRSIVSIVSLFRAVRVMLLLLVALPLAAHGQTNAANGFCDLGASQAAVSGLLSTNYLHGDIPLCTVTVYLTGTDTLATIYKDSSSDPLSNPFTAGGNGQWLFYAAASQGYDIVLSGGVAPNVYPSPVTLTDVYISASGGGGAPPSPPTYSVQVYNVGGTLTSDPNITINTTTHNLTAQGTNTVLNPTTFSGSPDIAQQIIAAGLTCSNSCTVDVPTGAWSVAANATAPAGIHLKFEAGAVVAVASGVTWTIDSELDAGRYQIFSGSGTVSFAGNSSLREIYPEWWGADPTGTNDSTVAWQDAINAAYTLNNAYSGTVSCGYSTFLISNTLTTFAMTTANGVSLQGPQGQFNNANGGCSLKWDGIAGGDMLHMIGGHTQRIEGINFNTNSLAARAIWLDSSNGTTAASYTISAIARSSNSVEVTTSAANTMTSGANVTISGVTDASYDGVFPVWYVIDSTHFVYVQTGADSSSSGGTAALVVSGDLEGMSVDHDGIFVSAMTPASISSAVITATGGYPEGELSVTLSSPLLIYPNQWIWISGSSDPVYNAYWQVSTVTSPTTFTAQAEEVASEAATTSGSVYPGNAGITMGSRNLALRSSSTCCTTFSDLLLHAPDAGPALFAFEQDGSGNTKNFTFQNNLIDGFRIAFMAINGGSIRSENNQEAFISDAVYATPGQVASILVQGDETETTGAFFFAFLVSGSSDAESLGTNGQFETGGSAIPGTLTLLSNELENQSFASDNTAVVCAGNCVLEANDFYNQASDAVPLVKLTSVTPQTNYNELTSINNWYENATGYAPVENVAGTPILGSGSANEAATVTSIRDTGGVPSSEGNEFVPLSWSTTLSDIRYWASNGTYNVPIAASGFMRLPNNITGIAWRNAANSGDDTLTANASDELTYNSNVLAVQLSGNTGSIGGSALAAGACSSGTVSITGLTTAMHVGVTPATYPGDGFWWEGYASAAGTATVKVCASAAGTPTASTYDVRVIQ